MVDQQSPNEPHPAEYAKVYAEKKAARIAELQKQIDLLIAEREKLRGG